MKSSEKIAAWAFLVAALITGGIYWLWPTGPWWVYLIVFLVAGGALYDQWLKMTAHERIIDRDGKT